MYNASISTSGNSCRNWVTSGTASPECSHDCAPFCQSVCLTAIADEFGTEIPCGDYIRIGGAAIGAEILRGIGASPAILLKQHGVFTIGATVQKALKAAVMVEDVARTVWLALQIGKVEELPAEEIAANFERYQTRYGTSQASRQG